MIATRVPVTLPGLLAFAESAWQHALDVLGRGVEALFLASLAVRVYSFLGFIALVAGVAFAARWLVATFAGLLGVSGGVVL